MCYTKEDQDAFSAESVREGLRIKDLIETAPYESIAESIKYLLRNRIITRGELVGVENYILGKSNVLKLRRDHSAAVLRKQHEQRKQQLQDPMNLGKAAQISSVKSVQKARVRAAMAA